ncbi:hypothetical protein T265_09721 [Opisthorchis viverrini]|uniref:Uncharacterized protein n=1 Tax=Opisthorchis viverrini TaxID=6198 RepID=A0A074Z4W5_OPIVI|nr:hypothetical protein T265_09721 [Opisthorchis viverrini]KER22103.1 hypothetical protein T265_09721 [Opisthorchis viverrini]
MNTIAKDLKGFEKYRDDVIVHAADKATHVSGDSYPHTLQTHFIPQLKQHKKLSTVFQPHGAASHYSNQLSVSKFWMNKA